MTAASDIYWNILENRNMKSHLEEYIAYYIAWYFPVYCNVFLLLKANSENMIPKENQKDLGMCTG